MIDDNILKLAQEFTGICSQTAKGFPAYYLDLTWPSIGAVDFLTYGLRGKSDLSQEEMQVIKGAAAYLAGIAYDCWSSFPEKLKLSLKPDEQGNIILSVQGGALLGKEQRFTVNISQSLKQVLLSPASPFPFFENSSRRVSSDHNLISLFAIGLVSGLCPYGSGLWSKTKTTDFHENLSAANVYLSLSCAEYYRRVFPDEELGQAPQLYMNNLVLPPATHAEPQPAYRATQKVIAYLQSIKTNDNPVEPRQISALCANLLGIPDELISSVGFTIGVALSDQRPSPALLAYGEAKSTYVPQLRSAIISARSAFGKPTDWLISIEQGRFAEAKELAQIERKLNILPFLWLPLDYLDKADLLPLFAELVSLQPELARQRIINLSAKNSADSGVILQGIYLDIIMQNIDQAQKALDDFKSELLSQHPRPHEYYQLCGALALMDNQTQRAVSFYEQAFADNIDDVWRLVDIGNNYAWALMLDSQFDQALKILDRSLMRNPYSITLKLNRAATLSQLGKTSEASEDYRELSHYAMMDRRTFEAVISDLRSREQKEFN